MYALVGRKVSPRTCRRQQWLSINICICLIPVNAPPPNWEGVLLKFKVGSTSVPGKYSIVISPMLPKPDNQRSNGWQKMYGVAVSVTLMAVLSSKLSTTLLITASTIRHAVIIRVFPCAPCALYR